jgi:hypothetical protein
MNICIFFSKKELFKKKQWMLLALCEDAVAGAVREDVDLMEELVQWLGK